MIDEQSLWWRLASPALREQALKEESRKPVDLKRIPRGRFKGSKREPAKVASGSSSRNTTCG